MNNEDIQKLLSFGEAIQADCVLAKADVGSYGGTRNGSQGVFGIKRGQLSQEK